MVKECEFLFFIDVVYLGFGEGLDEDVYGFCLFIENLFEVIVVVFCLKNFGLYCECVGFVVIIIEDSKICNIV